MTKKHKRELKLFEELQKQHGYTILALKDKKDRFGTHWRAKKVGKRSTLVYTPVVVMRLVVPEKSFMGREMKKLYDSLIGRPKKPRAPRPSRAKRAALSPKEKQDRDMRSYRGARMA